MSNQAKDNLVILIYDADPELKQFLTDSKLFTEEVFDRIKFVENDISILDVQYILNVISSHQRWVADTRYLLKRWYSKKTIDLEVQYGNLEIEVRSDVTKKYTIAEVKALIYRDNPEYVDQLKHHASVGELIDHLDTLLKILFARKDIAVERSIDERSERKADGQAL